jgi:hypothetical protein
MNEDISNDINEVSLGVDTGMNSVKENVTINLATV